MKDGIPGAVWPVFAISELGEIFDGPHATPKTVAEGPLFLGISSLADGRIELGKTRHVTEEDYVQWTRRVTPQPGDVVFAYETRLGQIGVIPEGMKCCLGRRMGLVRLDESRVLSEYFVYCYLSPNYQRFLRSRVVQGVTVDRIHLKDFKNFPMPLPPLEEQKRIVAVLDQAFAALDRARANAEANLADAASLYQRQRENLLGTASPDWRITTVGEVCERFEYGTSAKSSPEGSVPVLRMGNLQDGELDWTNLAYTDDAGDIAKLLLKPGDVLFNRTNSVDHVGKAAIFREGPDAIFAGYLIRLHLKKREADSEFINIFLNGDSARQYGRSIMGKSVNQANISASKLKDYPLPLPPLDEQKQIVRKLAEIRESVRALNEKYKQSLADIADLRQSLLQKAFSGQLTV